MVMNRYSTFPKVALTGVSPLDVLMSLLGHSLGESYSSAETQSVSSSASADWARVSGVLLLCRDAVGVFYSLGRPG